MPYAKHLEDAALPQVDGDRRRGRGGRAVAEWREFRMPSLGADMEDGTIVEWLVQPGDAVHRGDIVAVVDTDKADIEVEIFEDGVVEELLVPEGDKVPVGTPTRPHRPLGETHWSADSRRRRGRRGAHGADHRHALPTAADPSGSRARR